MLYFNLLKKKYCFVTERSKFFIELKPTLVIVVFHGSRGKAYY